MGFMKRMPSLLILLIWTTSLVLSACQPAANAAPPANTPAASSAATSATPGPTAEPSPTITTAPAGTQYGPTDFPVDVDPLTGLVVADPSLLQRRPVMVKVSNFPREGRPHAGLSKADIVFEYSTGGGWNRFLALFYGQDGEMVGPVRSGRIVDKWLVSMYQGILGMMFASDEVYDEIKDMLGHERIVRGTALTCPALCQLNFDNPIYSWFANTAEMTKYYEKTAGPFTGKPDLDGMAFNTAAPDGGKPGAEVTLHFGGNNEGQWKYDPVSRKYLRWIDNLDEQGAFSMIPLVDRTTDQQLAFSNVIVLFTTYTTLNAKDSMHKIDLADSGGRAMIFRDGYMYEAAWKGVSSVAPIQFFDAQGKPFELQPGNTWIAIVDNQSKVSEDPTGVFFVNFRKAPYQKK